MIRLFWIGLGSALGGMARHGIGHLLALSGIPGLLPTTLLVNVFGSGLLGYFAGSQVWRGGSIHKIDQLHFWTTGVCGGFTTFSAFSWQVLELVQKGEGQSAGLYAAGNVGFSLIAVWTGLSLAHRRSTR